ncbi:MAG: hypothetical protein HGA72_08365 [Chlorobiaceae bacterium]|nr:hypothetical protein [Chlorobiaceae bacterium]
MGLVTEIKKKKGRNEAYEVFIDGEYFSDIDAELIYLNGIRRGAELDEEGQGHAGQAADKVERHVRVTHDYDVGQSEGGQRGGREVLEGGDEVARGHEHRAQVRKDHHNHHDHHKEDDHREIFGR